MKFKDGCFCLMLEFSPKFIRPFKFNSRLMFRCGAAWLGFTLLKMSLYDYDKEVESGETEWIDKVTRHD